jgi:hypothetical protein
MKDEFQDIDDPVPSYEESSRLTNHTTSDSKAPRQHLQTQLAAARSNRIRSVLTVYIEPLLDAQILNCVARSTFILIPSDSLNNLPNISAKDLAGLPESACSAVVVQLHGPENQAAFWLQPTIVEQLTSDLKCRLASSGHRLEDASEEVQKPAVVATTAKSSWLKRNLGFGQQSDPTASTRHWKLGWRSEDEEGETNKKLALDEMRVRAKVKEVSVMTESELGLLLTETAKAVWLSIEIGT